jgi:hypothetical protein
VLLAEELALAGHALFGRIVVDEEHAAEQDGAEGRQVDVRGASTTAGTAPTTSHFA